MTRLTTKNNIAQKRRKQIITGLYKCLAAKGHERVTIKDIARAANVSYGALHYYFKNKKEIMLALVDDFVRQHEEMFERIAVSVPSPWERLHLMVSVATRELVFDKRTARVFLNLYQMGCTDREIRGSLTNSYKHFRRTVQKVVEYGISQGAFAKVDPGDAALLIVSAVEGLYLQLTMDPSLCSKDTADKLLYEAIRHHLNLMK
jgi:TetR/AcrR family transcriptional repressor of bet genes